MKECTATGKAKIAVLMATYNPRMDWLREQLLSLNAQDYPNLVLHIRDDCSPKVALEDIARCAEECITAFEYTIEQNEKNLGSNLTFERLTRECGEGEYYAYCDQDDVWHANKLSTLQAAMEREDAFLACSDMCVIDGEGKKTADSITEVRRRHVFRSGDGLAEKLLVSNWVTGCTMLVRAEAAKAAVPFCPYMVHDQYIALVCAERGKIIALPDALIDYRIHGSNQTSTLTGVTDKASYLEVRIEQMRRRMRWLKDNFTCGESMRAVIDDGIRWADARHEHWLHKGGTAAVYKYRYFSKYAAVFELVTAYCPEWLFRFAVGLIKKDKL